METLSPEKIQEFRRIIYGHYARHARDLPWRATVDPYKIIVSEIMLQQTQVGRVLGKYALFIRTFPTVEALARAPLGAILTAWQGLGYNRRALSLKKLAQEVVTKHKGKIPLDRHALKIFPGIGEATSGAVCAFAFNQPEVFIETNIRSVFLKHFFQDKKNISDAQLIPFIALTLDKKNPRKWYNALMDYGVFLKENHPNPSRKSLHYRKQGSFRGSNRQIRGAILKVMVEKKQIQESKLCAQLHFNSARIKAMICSLCKEGLIKKQGSILRI